MKEVERVKKIGYVIDEVIGYFTPDISRINHLFKVYSYAKTIGEMENLDEKMQEILEVTAVLHDIGIKVSEEKYQSSAGCYQEIEGPGIARKILEQLGYDEVFIERVCYIIAHHHTYHEIDGLDFQILVEADFLVNIDEDQMSKEAIQSIKEKIFKTRTGINYINYLYL